MPSPSMLYRAYREALGEKIPYPVFTNKSDTSVDVSIKIIWWEDPATQQG